MQDLRYARASSVVDAVRLLTDDELWWGQNQAALSSQRAWGWADAAAALEALIP